MASHTAIRDPHFPAGQGSMMDPAKFYHQFEQTVIGGFMPRERFESEIIFALVGSYFLIY